MSYIFKYLSFLTIHDKVALFQVENALYKLKIRENDMPTGAANITASTLT